MPTHSRKTILLATDQQRSVLNALDANRPHPIAYTPYGHRPLENGLLRMLGFNGERPDSLTGHYHLGNGYRQFNPVLMRFNSPDSWSPFGEGGLNTYTYCMGDPVNKRDPTGHAPTLLKFLLKLLGFKDVPSIKLKTESLLADAQKNTFRNIHSSYAPENTPRSAYLDQINLENGRQSHAAMLASNPEFTSRRTATQTLLETGQTVPAREHYSYQVLVHQSKAPTSPLLDRTRRLTFAVNQPETREIERLVPTPSGGWTKVADIRMPKRQTLWSRRNSTETIQHTP